MRLDLGRAERGRAEVGRAVYGVAPDSEKQSKYNVIIF